MGRGSPSCVVRHLPRLLARVGYAHARRHLHGAARLPVAPRSLHHVAALLLDLHRDPRLGRAHLRPPPPRRPTRDDAARAGGEGGRHRAEWPQRRAQEWPRRVGAGAHLELAAAPSAGHRQSAAAETAAPRTLVRRRSTLRSDPVLAMRAARASDTKPAPAAAAAEPESIAVLRGVDLRVRAGSSSPCRARRQRQVDVARGGVG